MALIDLWKSNPEAVSSLKIEQVVSTAGDGLLRDSSLCSSELRQYLASVSVEKLSEYSDRCLTNSFPNGGKALQDIVNELGRRLDFEVTNGRYQGVQGQVYFSKTEREKGKHYWHIKILQREGPRHFIQLSNSEHDLPIDEYKLSLI